MSRFVGVSRNSNGGDKCWQARVWHKGKYHWLGNFYDEESAHEAIVQFKQKKPSPPQAVIDFFSNPILPEQCKSSTGQDTRLGKELLLRFAMLQQAVKDLQSPHPVLQRTARDWLTGATKAPRTFSFKEICDLCEADQKKAIHSMLNLYASSQS